MPIFSIVIPVYNCEAYIKDTLNSLYNQTFVDYEVIVIDGGSTDTTLQIIKENADKLAYYVSEKDNGMYSALEKGFKVAKGQYFCYINADDRLLPETLQRVYEKFSTGSYSLIFGDVNFISSSGDIIYQQKGVNFSASAIEYLARVPFAQQSAFWTKEVYEKIGGFDASLKYVADSKFFMQILINKELKKGYIPGVLGEFRMHANSFSISQKQQMNDEGQQMRLSLGLRKNTFLKYAYEVIFKIINAKNILNKILYKGHKL